MRKPQKLIRQLASTLQPTPDRWNDDYTAKSEAYVRTIAANRQALRRLGFVPFPGVGSEYRGNVYLNRELNLVVKVGETFDDIASIPRKFRPQRWLIAHGWVLQPRYRRGSGAYECFRCYHGVSTDAHSGNWGRREDGSCVLFDF